MRLVFLGTSSGTPTRTRNVSGLAINRANRKSWFLVDCGEATQHQLLRTDHSLSRLAGIFITHVHGDHCYGLPGLLASAAKDGRRNPLHLVGPEPLKAFIDSTIAATRLHLPYEIRFHPVESLDQPLQLNGFDVSPVTLSHRVPSWAYRFAENDVPVKLDGEKLTNLGIPPGPAWGQLQNGQDVVTREGKTLNAADYTHPARDPRIVVIAGDNDTPELLAEACEHACLLVHETTFCQDWLDAGNDSFGHSSALQVARFAHQASLANLVLTHFSPRYQLDPLKSPSIEDIRTEARNVYSGRLYLASDLDSYTLDNSGVLTLAR